MNSGFGQIHIQVFSQSYIFAIPYKVRYNISMRKLPFAAIVLLLSLIFVSQAPAETVDLLLFNTWNGLSRGGFFAEKDLEEPGARDFRRELLERGIAEYEPDILGLLELNPLPKSAESLGETFSLKSVYQADRGGVRIGPVGLPANLRSGMALFCGKEFPLEDRAVRKLTGGMPGELLQIGDAALVLYGVTEIEDRRVHLFITHWDESLYSRESDLKLLIEEYDSEEIDTKELTALIKRAAKSRELRLKQAAATLDFINEVAGGEPAILMGTLAVHPESEELAVLKNAGFRDTRERGGATWDEENNPNTSEAGDLYAAGISQDRVDYVLIRGEGIRSRSSSIVFNQETYGAYPSDHYGLLVRLEVDPEE